MRRRRGGRGSTETSPSLQSLSLDPGTEHHQTVRHCVEIKVQLVLQFGVSRGLREVLLAPVGRVYLSEIVSKFEPKTWPRCRDSETQMVA